MLSRAMFKICGLFLWVSVSASLSSQIPTTNSSTAAVNGYDEERVEAARQYLMETWKDDNCLSLAPTGNHYEKLVFIAMAANVCPDNTAAYDAAVFWFLKMKDLGTLTGPSTERLFSAFLDYAVRRHLNIVPHSDKVLELEKAVIEDFVAQSHLERVRTRKELDETDSGETDVVSQEGSDEDEPYVEEDSELTRPSTESDVARSTFCALKDYGPDNFQVVLSIAVALVICNTGPTVAMIPSKWVSFLSNKFTWEKDSNTDERRFLEYALRRNAGNIELDAGLKQMESVIATQYRRATMTQPKGLQRNFKHTIPLHVLGLNATSILRD